MSGELEREIALLERSLASGIEQMRRMTARMVVMQATLARIRKAAGGDAAESGGRAGGTPPAIEDGDRSDGADGSDETRSMYPGFRPFVSGGVKP